MFPLDADRMSPIPKCVKTIPFKGPPPSRCDRDLPLKSMPYALKAQIMAPKPMPEPLTPKQPARLDLRVRAVPPRVFPRAVHVAPEVFAKHVPRVVPPKDWSQPQAVSSSSTSESLGLKRTPREKSSPSKFSKLTPNEEPEWEIDMRATVPCKRKQESDDVAEYRELCREEVQLLELQKIKVELMKEEQADDATCEIASTDRYL